MEKDTVKHVTRRMLWISAIFQSINQSIFICSKCPEIHIKGFSIASRTTRLRPALTVAQLINYTMKEKSAIHKKTDSRAQIFSEPSTKNSTSRSTTAMMRTNATRSHFVPKQKIKLINCLFN